MTNLIRRNYYYIMRRFCFLILFFIFIVISFVNCSKISRNDLHKKELEKHWLNEKIIINDNIYVLTPHDVKLDVSPHKRILIHTFESGCKSCIYTLNTNLDFFNNLENHGVKIYLIDHTYNQEVAKNNIGYYPKPILLDNTNSFRNNNKLFSSQMASILLDEENKIILFGDIFNESFKKDIMKELGIK